MRSVLALAALALLPFAAGAQHVTHAHPTDPARQGAKSARFAGQMNAGMEKMMRDMHSPGYTGNPDIDFLAMMIPHHEGAVEMARLVLLHGTDPATRRLAEDIIAGQTVEIEAMTGRLVLLRAGTAGSGGYPALGGTRGPGPAR